MSIAINAITFVLTAVLYTLRDNLKCDLLDHTCVALKVMLAPGAYSVQVATTTRSKQHLDASNSAESTTTPISASSLDNHQPRIIRPLPHRIRGKLPQLGLALVPPKPKTTTFISGDELASKGFVNPEDLPAPVVSSASTQTTASPTFDDTIPVNLIPYLPAHSQPAPESTSIVATTEKSGMATTIEDVIGDFEPLTTSETTPAPADSAPTSNDPTLVPIGTSPEPTSAPAEPILAVQAESIAHVTPEPTVPTSDPQHTPEHTPAPALPEPSPLPGDLPPTIPPHLVDSNDFEATLVPTEDAHPTPAEPVSLRPEGAEPILESQDTAQVLARAPNMAARPDWTVDNTTEGLDCKSIAPPSMSGLARPFGEMTIQELVDHVMEDWTGLFEMDVDERPTVGRATELLGELELGMWDCIEDMERWSMTEVTTLAVTVAMRDIVMSSPTPITALSKLPNSPMALDAHDDIDLVMETPTLHSCVDTEMDMDSTWNQTPTWMDWVFSAPNPAGLAPLAPSVATWASEVYAQDIHIDEIDASFGTKLEGGEMEGVVEEEWAEVEEPPTNVNQELVASMGQAEGDTQVGAENAEDIASAQPDEVPVNNQALTGEPAAPGQDGGNLGVLEIAHEEPQALDELTNELAGMWSSVAVIAAPEDPSDSEGLETEIDVEEGIEAELDALEEEYFSAAAEDFLAGLEAGLLSAQA
ncbi:hypothetical protein OPQ81_007475 [Rhizoctonia solani]|nr:hypothetical protein OPQ81_007475 [Rhizoctonia solani]